MLESVQSIFIRQVTKGDFFAIERHPSQAPVGGGGQTYFDIPLNDAGLSKEKLWQFLGVQPPDDPIKDAWPHVNVRVGTIGTSDSVSDLTFGARKGNNRYKISNQARQSSGSNRHPAWTKENGFPTAPDNVKTKDDALVPDLSHLKIYMVKTYEGNYYAGFVNADSLPANWPQSASLETLFSNTSCKMLQFSPDQVLDLPPLVTRILDAWSRKKNVLLYGPPGTGKTYAMQKLWELLAQGEGGNALALDPSNKDAPFVTQQVALPFPTPVRREWVTFHQNFSYENFVLGLRPDSSDGALKLVPHAGVLLDAAMSVDATLEQKQHFGAAVVVIDEINRGNVSRIFGEFITFMDDEYRASGDNSKPNAGALPVPLPNLRGDGKGHTEPIERTGDAPVVLPMPWHFPQSVYLLASMNSVDRAVAPLDTALARRFERIEVGPDLEFLGRYFGIDTKALLLAPPQPTVGDPIEDDVELDDLSDLNEDAEVATESTNNGEISATPVITQNAQNALETAWLLLYRLNYELAATLGADFEIGHTYLMDLKPEGQDELTRFRLLAKIWDGALYPQLRERFASRPEELSRLLRIGNNAPTNYLFQPRRQPATSLAGRVRPVIDFVSLRAAFESGDAGAEAVKTTLRFLAGARL